MNAPLPTSYTSPMAGFVNALARLAIAGLDKRVRELEALRRDALELRHALREAQDFADTEAAGYIDRSFLEAS